jgi:hypothetical protein
MRPHDYSVDKIIKSDDATVSFKEKVPHAVVAFCF